MAATMAMAGRLNKAPVLTNWPWLQLIGASARAAGNGRPRVLVRKLTR